MNHIFKTLWSAVHQQYVVTNEKQASHGKPSKTVLTAVVASAVMAMAGNAVAYQESGVIGDSASWKTAEYMADWGLEAMHAADAYALGFNGQGAVVGMMDTGALSTHPEFDPKRFGYVEYDDGVFSSSGNRYPVAGFDTFGNGTYKVGQHFVEALNAEPSMTNGVNKITGAWIKHVNDSHGTHVVGTIGANRDGVGMHGVAFGADVIVANNGGLDNSNYGPFQDYAFYKEAYSKAVAGVDGKAPKFINSSWGTNARIIAPLFDEKGKPIMNEDGKTQKEGQISLPVNNVKQTEYEYFLFNKVAKANWDEFRASGIDEKQAMLDGRSNGELTSFVDAIYESVKNEDTIHMITTGNRAYEQPYYRANYPYFHPEAEDKWVAVAGLQKADGGKFVNIARFNDPGEAKWWAVVAPGRSIYSSVVCEDTYIKPEDYPGLKVGDPSYEAFSGTSMANPHVTGALGVLASRYPDMTSLQVRNTMFTTANHKNPDGSIMEGWKAAEGTPDVRYGWGVPDLAKGMYGPAQFLGALNKEGEAYSFDPDFKYELEKDHLDVWSNDISQTAFDARLKEDEKWNELKAKWDDQVKPEFEDLVKLAKKDKLSDEQLDAVRKEFMLGDKVEIDVLNDKEVEKKTVDLKLIKSHKATKRTDEEKKAYLEEQHAKGNHPTDYEASYEFTNEFDNAWQQIALEDAIKWRDLYYEKRAAANEARKGKKLGLVKQGTGTLVMTGHNTYKGETTVEGGTLLAFSEAIPNGEVTVKSGATFGLLSHYDDELTRRGHLVSDGEVRDLAVNLKDGGKFCISGLADLEVGELTGVEEIHVGTLGSDPELLAKAYVDGLAKKDGKTVAGSFKFKPNSEKEVKFIVEGAASQTGKEVAATEGSPAIMTLVAIQPPSELVAEPQALVTLDGKPKIEEGKVVFGLQVNKDASLSSFYEAEDENEKAVLSALATDANPFLGRAIQATLTGASEARVAKIAAIVKPLSDETVALARNVMVNSNLNVVNSALRGAHDGLFLRTAKTDDANLWVNTSVSKGHVKGNDVKLKSSFDTVMVGGDYRLNQTVKAGAFFGYGHDVAKESPARISQHSLHAGVYGLADVAGVEVTGVASWTHSDRKINNSVYSSELSDKADACSIYGEAGLPVSVKEDFRVTPYVGAGYMHVKGEDMTTEVAGAPVTFVAKASNLGFGKVGARAEGVVYTGEVDLSVKADAGYTHFFGDKTAEQDVALGGSSVATIKTKKLDGMFNLGLGMNVKFSPKCEGELSYHGDFGKAVKDNGVFGSIKVHF